MKFNIVFDNMEFILKSTLITIQITFFSFLLGIILAVVIGVLRSGKKPRPIEMFLHFYIEIFRGSPLLIQLFFIYYGLPSVGITMSSFTAAVLGLALNGAAYMSEIVRAAIISVDKGQEEAAFSLGMNKLEMLWHIVLPQALRIAIPPLVNSFSALLKDTSLVSVLSITELTRSGQLIYTRTSRPFEVYLTLGIMYFVMTYIVAILSKQLEKYMNRMYK